MRTQLRLLLVTLAVVGSMVLPVSAQPKVEALLLPVELPGHFTPINSDQLTLRLDTRLKQLAKRAHLQMARRADLTAYQYTAGASDQPPTAQMAETLCNAYKTRYVCWTSIRFQPHYDQASHSLALAGAARVWLYSQADGRAMIDQPLSLVRSGTIANIKDEKQSRKVAMGLASGCVDDLGMQLVYIAQQRNQTPVAAAPVNNTPAPAGFQPTKNYNDMLKAIDSYQRATANQNYMDVTQSEQNMSSLWLRLNKAEQTALGGRYPTIVQMMTAPPYGGYWPYYY
ncbi:hypothetical protein IV102_12320 [bacterium]|nr:hypothetical protein [bacterium]